MKIAPEDKKKVRALGILGVILLGAIYYSFFSGPSTSYKPPAAPAKDRAVDTMPTMQDENAPRGPGRNQARTEEFHPVLHPKRKEDQISPDKIDPVIKMYLLAQLQEVPAAGKGRNLFQFGEPPKPKELKGPETQVAVAKPFFGPPVVDFTPKPPPPPPPPPPPTPFGPKYYGLATTMANGRKRAFFLDGEDIIIKAEGETVKGHFRLVRIGQTSCVVEDTDSKRQQTIQIAEDAQG